MKRTANFYSEIFSDIDRGDIVSISDLREVLDPALDLNYRRLLPENKDARILDVGCGWGYFLYYLKVKGFSNIEGIDLKRHIKRLDFIRKNITTNVFEINSVEEYLNSHSDQYDFIILQQVIYYFKRDELPNIMAAIRKSLRPGGILIVETFNGSLFTGAFTQNWDIERKLVFTEYSLAKLLLESGFELKELFGMRQQNKKSLKRAVYLLLQQSWFCLLKMIYILERGIQPSEIPQIFSKFIIAVAQKPK